MTPIDSRGAEDLVAKIRHDLRTPLNAILGFALLLEMEELGTEQAEYLAEIIKGGRRLLELINQD